MLKVMPEYFAAYASYSGGLGSTMGTCDVPLFQNIGENNGAVGGLDGTLTAAFITRLTNYLVSNFGYTAEAAATLVANPAINGVVEDLNNGMVHKTWEWQNANGVPIYRTSTTSKRGHSFLIADTAPMAEWFTHWSRVNGKIVYKS